MDDNPAIAPSPPSLPFSVVAEDPSALPLESEGGAWDWGNFLDLSDGEDDCDHQKQQPQHHQQVVSPPPRDVEENPVGAVVLPIPAMEAGTSGRVRKRDLRLVCENYLAGRIPCACPEMDEKEGEEEDEEDEQMSAGAEGIGIGGGRKKARLGGGGGGGVVVARCQVPGCEVDIRELKGYHRRHRVCLRCANASSVMLDGEPKRYCQQCGKFHILTDFDEGKRSCRRKLERHNKRRRRKPSDSKEMLAKENEISENLNMEATPYGDGQTKDSLKETSHGFDNLCISNKSVDMDVLHPPDKCSSPFHSEPSVRAGCSNGVASSFAVSSEAQLDGMDNPISAISSSICENQSIFSTSCPTGRISFKLYDWNPAEFPRRLRHQIFHWLASMPVELEGYIRPGCTILTLFIAMPHHMWNKLSKDAAQYLQHFVNTPDSLLFGRGNIHIYLNNTIFQVLQDGTSLLNVKMEVHVPKIHYVQPIIFEAGKAVEFFACGSNIFRPNFRFLVSFAGKYLEHEFEMLRCEVEVSQDCEHQIYRIRIPQTKPELLGPAFIEVENDSGLSNFVPILLVDKPIFPELQKLQRSGNLGTGMMPILGNVDAISNFCDVCTSKQSSVTELLLDIAWLLKKPQLDSHEAFFSIGNIHRLNRLLGYLVEKGSVNILKKVLHYVEAMVIEKKIDDLVDRNHEEVQLFEKIMDDVNKILHQKHLHGEVSDLDPKNKTCVRVLNDQADIKGDILYPFPIKSQEIDGESMIGGGAVLHDNDEKISLLIKNTVEEEGCLRVKWPLETYAHFYRTVTFPRAAIFMMATVVLCFGFCIALLHPRKATESIISVHRRVSGLKQ